MSKKTIDVVTASVGLNFLKETIEKALVKPLVHELDVAFLPAADFPDLEKQKEKVNGNDGPKVSKPAPKFR